MAGEHAIAAVIKTNGEFVVPAWVTERLGWPSSCNLAFALRPDGSVEVAPTGVRVTRMVRRRIHIPADIRRALALREGDVVELHIEDGKLIIRRREQGEQ